MASRGESSPRLASPKLKISPRLAYLFLVGYYNCIFRRSEVDLETVAL